jgi:hypothetical protein
MLEKIKRCSSPTLKVRPQKHETEGQETQRFRADKSKWTVSVVATPEIPAPGRQKEEDHEFMPV